MGVVTMWLFWKAETQPPPSAEPSPAVERLADGTSPPGPGGEAGRSGPADSRADARRAESPTATIAPEWSPSAALNTGDPVTAPAKQPARWQKTFERERYAVSLSSEGATLTSWKLKDYHVNRPDGEVPVELLQVVAPYDRVLRTPFTGLGFGDLGDVEYQVREESADAVTFVLEREGAEVIKGYRFEDPYGLVLSLEVRNTGSRTLSPTFTIQWPAAVVADAGPDFQEQSLAALYDGSIEKEMIAGIGTPGFLGGLFGGDTGPQIFNAQRGDVGTIDWAGIDLKYFISALLPDRPRSAQASFVPLVPGKVGATFVAFERVDIPPGQMVRRELRGFLGPKEASLLDSAGAELDRSIDRGYAWIAPLVGFFDWMLHACYAVIPNYGVAIIIITVLVRIVTAPIMTRQMRSSERMREMQPQIKEIQEKYADDRQKQSEEMMRVWKETGFNPLSGCLPMILQLPVFIGLFFALQSSIALRQAPFMLWIQDLSVPESLFTIPGIDLPFRLLPIVMGASMILQQKMTPMTMDPAQARMMTTVMPIMMTVLFYRFPSGLVLYWMVSNFLGIGHQMWIGRKMRK